MMRRLKESIEVPIDSLRAPVLYKISRMRQQNELYKNQARQVSLAQREILRDFTPEAGVPKLELAPT